MGKARREAEREAERKENMSERPAPRTLFYTEMVDDLIYNSKPITAELLGNIVECKSLVLAILDQAGADRSTYDSVERAMDQTWW